MANTAIVETLENMIHQDLGKQVYEMLPSFEVEPFFAGLGLSSRGVGQFGGVTRGWQIHKTLSTGLAGQFRWDSVSEDTMTDNTASSPARAHTIATKLPSSRYPSAIGLPMPAIVQITVPLTKARGTIAWPSEYLRVEKLTDAMAEYTELAMKGMSKMIALNQANSWFAPSNGVIADVEDVTSGYDGNATNELITTIDAGRIFQFEDGMLVDIYYHDSGTPGTSDVWAQRNVNGSGTSVRGVVDGVDALNGVLRVYFDEELATAVTDGDHIILADTYVDATDDYARKGPLGINDMMKLATTGSQYVMSPNNSSSYGFNLDKYPKFGSLLDTDVGTLDETTLNRYLGTFFDATGATVDTIVTTRGVKNKMAEYPMLDGNRQVWDRTNAGIKYTAGRGDVNVTYEGQTWGLTQSRFCPPGTLYALKKKGNYSIAVPPSQPDTTQKATDLGPPIEFTGQSLGYASDFIPVLAGSGVHTDMVQAPFQMFYQVVCQDPRGIKLTGITEDE